MLELPSFLLIVHEIGFPEAICADIEFKSEVFSPDVSVLIAGEELDDLQADSKRVVATSNAIFFISLALFHTMIDYHHDYNTDKN